MPEWLLACRQCGVLTMKRQHKCPACESSNGNWQAGRWYDRVDARDLLEAIDHA